MISEGSSSERAKTTRRAEAGELDLSNTLQLMRAVVFGSFGARLSCRFRVIDAFLAGCFGSELVFEALDEGFAEEGVEGELDGWPVMALVREEFSEEDEAVDMLFGYGEREATNALFFAVVGSECAFG